jgi:hypothetical protein
MSAEEATFGGTFIGAVIAEDGIIIGSDSRSTFLDESGAHIGYVDGMSKVFVKHGTAFAVSGLTSVGDELFGSFVRRNDFLLDRPVNEVLHSVAVHLPLKNATNVLLLSAGFVDGEAMICAKDPINPQVCHRKGFIVNKRSASLNQWQSNLDRLPKAQDAAAALRQSILEFSAADPGVGGPLAIVRLSRDAPPQWLENGSQDHNWSRICDLVADYRRNRAQIGFINSKEQLDRFLNAVCPGRKR